jgi:hypothetical protein
MGKQEGAQRSRRVASSLITARGTNQRLGKMTICPLYVLTHHKCASTWLGRYINEYCELNAFSMFHSHLSGVLPDRPSELAVLTNASYPFLNTKLNGGLHIIRNPLDIIVSAYFSHRETHPLDGWPELVAQRRVLRSAQPHDGMLLTVSFLERDDFYRGAEGPLHALRHWDFTDERFTTVRMEDVVADPNGQIGAVLRGRYPDTRLPEESRHTFEAVAGRELGKVDETSHYRSGKTDQWREALPPSVIDYVRAHFAPLLQRFYPHALSWPSGSSDPSRPAKIERGAFRVVQPGDA